MFNLMFDYAVEYELTDRNYARTFKITDNVINEMETVHNAHISFKDWEIDKLWNHVEDVPYVDLVLIHCYLGVRPQELGLFELENVDLENNTMKGGMKTDAGKNRIVPIHSKIKDLVVEKYKQAEKLESKYIFNCTDAKNGRTFLTYDKYRHRFVNVVNVLKLNPDHRPHDPRKHFITMAKKYEVDEYAIKYIVGHAINDITERVYTDREIDWLKAEIEKIK